MKKIAHRYFAQLNFETVDDPDVIWEKEIHGVNASLLPSKSNKYCHI